MFLSSSKHWLIVVYTGAYEVELIPDPKHTTSLSKKNQAFWLRYSHRHNCPCKHRRTLRRYCRTPLRQKWKFPRVCQSLAAIGIVSSCGAVVPGILRQFHAGKILAYSFPLSYDIGTSVRHEISFEVFSVAVFTTHGAGGYSTDVERIAGAYVQGIVSSEIMCMQRL